MNVCITHLPNLPLPKFLVKRSDQLATLTPAAEPKPGKSGKEGKLLLLC